MLKVFDELGNEAASLIIEKKSVGTYEVILDEAKLQRGVHRI